MRNAGLIYISTTHPAPALDKYTDKHDDIAAEPGEHWPPQSAFARFRGVPLAMDAPLLAPNCETLLLKLVAQRIHNGRRSVNVGAYGLKNCLI